MNPLWMNDEDRADPPAPEPAADHGRACRRRRAISRRGCELAGTLPRAAKAAGQVRDPLGRVAAGPPRSSRERRAALDQHAAGTAPAGETAVHGVAVAGCGAASGAAPEVQAVQQFAAGRAGPVTPDVQALSEFAAGTAAAVAQTVPAAHA